MKRKYFLVYLLVPIGMFLTYLAKLDPFKTEYYYSNVVYRPYSQIFNFIFGNIPFSVAELILVGGVFGIIGKILYCVKNAIFQKSFVPIAKCVIHLSMLASVLYIWFVLACGINYHRIDFVWYYGGEQRDYSIEELKEMCIHYILQAEEIREFLTEEDYRISKYEMAKYSAITFNQLSDTYPVLYEMYGQPKSILLSSFMSHTQITGVYFPYTVEANVNVAIPSFQIPFVMLHEQAHQRGFMQENEANFIAFLAGKESKHLFTKYSAYMSAANYALNSLYAVDKDVYREACTYFTPLVLEDRLEQYEYWLQFKDRFVSETVTNMNDSYLKANGQNDGVASYGQVTELLLLDYYSDIS